MSNKKPKQKEFKVYYFKGDYFSSEGEQRYVTMISADNERDAEYIFKKIYPNCSFGWIDEIRKEK
jgi:hypothetical protein